MADITKGVRSFTLGTAISRVTGLFREMIFAFLYGANTATDAFQASFRLLDLLRDLFAETTLSSAIIPILTEEKAKGKHRQNILASNIFNLLLIVVGIITLLSMLLAPYLVRIIVFGFANTPGKLDLTLQLAVIIMPFLLFIAFAAWAMSYLNTENRFFIPAVAPAWFNVFSIITPVLLYAYFVNRGINPIFGMAFGVLVGGAMQFFIQIPALIKNGFHYYFCFNIRDPALKKVILLFLPVAIGLAGSRINVMVDTIMVSFLEERSMTWLHYAFRIMHLPLGLFGIAVGAVALPSLSKLVVENNLIELRKTLIDSLKLVFLLTIFCSVFIIFFSTLLTEIIYQRGRFSTFDTTATASALIFYIIGVPFTAGLRNVAAAFYAFKDSKTPMYVSLAMVGANVVLNYVLMRLMSYRGIALATSISAFLNFVILMSILPKKVGNVEIRELVKYIISITVCAILSSFLGFILYRYLAGFFSFGTFLKIIIIIVIGFLVLFIFYMLCLLSKISDAVKFLRRFIKR
ncbi:MAG: murein biosynthesis integral membrane protein MurJ [bacterium]